MMPREPHLLDYLMILRKHQWLIVSFLLAVVTIVTIATFRMQPVYEATTRIEIDRENTSILPFTGQTIPTRHTRISKTTSRPNRKF